MSSTLDPEKTSYRFELEQTVRAHVAQLSAEAGLEEPTVNVVPFLKVRPPTINAHFRKPGEVPTITITERAVQELPHRVLRFLLAHEVGHFAHWEFREQMQRLIKFVLLGGMIFLLGFLLAVAGIGDSIPGFLMLGTGVVVGGGSLLVLQARSRVDEYWVDAFAARLTGDLAAAREYFAALDQNQQKGLLGPLSSHPSIPNRLGAVEKILNQTNAQGSAP